MIKYKNILLYSILIFVFDYFENNAQILQNNFKYEVKKVHQTNLRFDFKYELENFCLKNNSILIPQKNENILYLMSFVLNDSLNNYNESSGSNNVLDSIILNIPDSLFILLKKHTKIKSIFYIEEDLYLYIGRYILKFQNYDLIDFVETNSSYYGLEEVNSNLFLYEAYNKYDFANKQKNLMGIYLDKIEYTPLDTFYFNYSNLCMTHYNTYNYISTYNNIICVTDPFNGNIERINVDDKKRSLLNYEKDTISKELLRKMDSIVYNNHNYPRNIIEQIDILHLDTLERITNINMFNDSLYLIKTSKNIIHDDLNEVFVKLYFLEYQNDNANLKLLKVIDNYIKKTDEYNILKYDQTNHKNVGIFHKNKFYKLVVLPKLSYLLENKSTVLEQIHKNKNYILEDDLFYTIIEIDLW